MSGHVCDTYLRVDSKTLVHRLEEDPWIWLGRNRSHRSIAGDVVFVPKILYCVLYCTVLYCSLVHRFVREMAA